MSEAYKCDRCARFIEGEPVKLWLDVYLNMRPFAPMDYLAKKQVELCKDCFKATKQFLGI